MNVRNFLLVATEAEMQVERDLSIERGDTERAGYVEECLCELRAESAECAVCYDETDETSCRGCHLEAGRDDYPGFRCCEGGEDCVGCPESGDCADETY
jgi:hypothetical protein